MNHCQMLLLIDIYALKLFRFKRSDFFGLFIREHIIQYSQSLSVCYVV